MDLSLLKPAVVFATVVEAGSFRAGAERLGLSAAYVSQLVADLETRLGRQLLYRSTRKLALSSDGELFLGQARRLTEALEAGEALFREAEAGLTGRLRLSVPSVLATPAFAAIVDAFQARHPGLCLDLRLDDDPVDPLEGRIDLAIRIGPPAEDGRPARLLFRTQGVICAAPDAAQTLREPADLAGLRWIKTPAMGASLTLRDSAGEQAELRSDEVLVTNNGQLALHLVRRGTGWAVFPEFAVREALAQGVVARVLPDWSVPEVGVWGLHSARSAGLSTGRVFLDFLEARLRAGGRAPASGTP